MKIRLYQNDIVRLGFVLLAVGSAIYVSVASINYLNFWPALDKLTAQTTKVILSRDANTNQTLLFVQFLVSNPSDYTGFEFWQSSAVVYFFDMDQINLTLFTGQPLAASSSPMTRIGANDRIQNNLQFQLSPANSTALWSFVGNRYGRVLAHVTLRVDVVTFLNPVLGHTHLDDDNNYTLSSS